VPGNETQQCGRRTKAMHCAARNQSPKQLADPRGDIEQPNPGDHMRFSNKIISVAGANWLMEGAKTPQAKRKDNQEPERCVAGRHRCCKQSERCGGAKFDPSQQGSAVDPIGNCARQDAENKERQKVYRQRDSDPGGRSCRLIDEQTNNHLFAAHALSTEYSAGKETTIVAVLQRWNSGHSAFIAEINS